VKKSRRRVVGWALAALAVVVLSAWALRRWAPSLFLDRGALETFLEQHDSGAPLLFMGLQAAQVVLAPIPGHLLGVVAGAAFGLLRGTLYTVIGVGTGSAIVLALSRVAGRPLVQHLAPGERLVSVDRWAARRGPLFFFLFFMLPFLPDDLACFAVGLSSLPLLPMLGLIVAARLPGHFAAAWLGATATRLPPAGWVGIALFSVGVLGVYWRHHRRIEDWLIHKLDQTETPRRKGP